MSIVLNEYDWAENMIRNRDLGKSPGETLSRVSKYYFSQNYSKKEVRRMLDLFMVQCDPRVSLVQWSDTLDKIVKNVDKHPLIMVEKVDITYLELNKIKELKSKQARRLAFTLLCVAKYWNTVSEKNDNWVNTSDREIMRLSNINTSIVRQSALFGELRDAGLIRFSKKIDNLNVQVTFVDTTERVTALQVKDFRNLGYQYMKYYGSPYFECSNCGIVSKINDPKMGRPQKYCASCAAEIKTRQNIDAVMRRRTVFKS